jgi:hypothetical protein
MNLPKTKDELYGTYILKNDLVLLCKEYNLPTSGSKENLLEYLSNYIENKPVKKQNIKLKAGNNDFEPLLDKIIDTNYSNNEIHRAFFLKTIGNNFKFNVKFMNWMNEKKGKKSYKDAIEIYNKILLDKKSGKKTEIGKQFEYNQYTRDFFTNNPKLNKGDCIKCWNYKKNQIGNHKYENDDLKILEKSNPENLKENIYKIHTTELGIIRIKNNLGLETNDVIDWCKNEIMKSNEYYKAGKNWYVSGNGFTITINGYNFCIITAKKIN